MKKKIFLIIPLALMLHIAVVFFYFRMRKNERIRTNCSEVSYVKFENHLETDGMDSVADFGNIYMSSDSICRFMGSLNESHEIEKPLELIKFSTGELTLFFYNTHHLNVGNIRMKYSKGGYVIHLGGDTWYHDNNLVAYILRCLKVESKK